VFTDVLPKLFGQFSPGEWVFADYCGQCGVGLHGFAKGVFGRGGFLRGRHRAIRTRRAWLPSEKSTRIAVHDLKVIEYGQDQSAMNACPRIAAGGRTRQTCVREFSSVSIPLAK